MVTATRSRKRRARPTLQLHKPAGVIGPRVQAVGPGRFGIVAVDCAKARSKWMLCDFYGQVLIPPTPVEHTQPGLRLAVELVRAVAEDRGLRQVVVAVERTGNYHRPVQRAFAAAGYETRVVHPFATQQFRQAANPGDKTDDHDLAAIHRATVTGFGLCEAPLDEAARRLRTWVRHRRDFVRKCAAIQCQIREHLEAMLPGFAALFAGDNLWTLPLPLTIARQLATPAEVLSRGVAGLTELLVAAGVRFHKRSLQKVLAWAEQAAPPDPDAALHQRVLRELDDDRRAKQPVIQALELDIAACLAATPYILWLAIPGINVVSAAELGGELGPISHYANANAITGRAGLFPSRHQSDAVDKQGGMIRCCNKRLRFALLQVADNLLKVNEYFRGRRALWFSQHVQRAAATRPGRPPLQPLGLRHGGRPADRAPSLLPPAQVRARQARGIPSGTRRVVRTIASLPRRGSQPTAALGVSPRRGRTPCAAVDPGVSAPARREAAAGVVGRTAGQAARRSFRIYSRGLGPNRPRRRRADNAYVPMALDALLKTGALSDHHA